MNPRRGEVERHMPRATAFPGGRSDFPTRSRSAAKSGSGAPARRHDVRASRSVAVLLPGTGNSVAEIRPSMVRIVRSSVSFVTRTTTCEPKKELKR